MDYGGVDKRKSKNDKKKKRLRRAYKRGGKFRGMNISETRASEEKEDKKNKKGKK